MRMERLFEIAAQLEKYEESVANELKDWLSYDLDTQLRKFNHFFSIFLTKLGEKRIKIIKSDTAKKEPIIENDLREIQNEIFCLREQINSYHSANNSAALAIIAAVTLNEYERLKKNSLDYDDILLNAIKVLKSGGNSSWVLQQLDMNIDHILVDEAQDLSPIQWTIIQILSEDFFAGDGAVDINRTIFIVGDLKQSIFSFQGAEPGIFKQMCKYYKNKVHAVAKKWIQVDLNISFRSSSAVLQLVDKVFSNSMIYNKLGIDLYHNHIPYRQTIGKFELLPLITKLHNAKEGEIDTKEWEIPTDQIDTHDPRLALAYSIATMINEWLQSKKQLQNNASPIAPQNIMIIFRKRSIFQDYVITNLKNFNIPISLNCGVEVSDNIVIQDIFSIMKFITNPNDDLNLACLLKSPIIGIDEQTLLNLCHGRGKSSVWEMLLTKEPVIGDELTTILHIASNHSLYDFLHILLFKNKKIEPLLMRLGLQVESIIYKILDKVLEFEELYPHRRFESLIQWLQKEDLKIRGDNKDGVQIHTAHSAKGLQAAIVILADASDSENTPHENILWDHASCFLSIAHYDDPFLKQLKQQLKNSRYAESLRLLYVALTRAEDELYICGWEGNKIEHSWYQIIKAAI